MGLGICAYIFRFGISEDRAACTRQMLPGHKPTALQWEDGFLLLLNHMSHEIRCYSYGFILTNATSSSDTSKDEATAVAPNLM
jgi:hypothetical protein